jgi:iron complex transport system substrate-binding protein
VRIVSLLPAATEILLALGLGPEVVGVTELCETPGFNPAEWMTVVACRATGSPDNPAAPRGEPNGEPLLVADGEAMAAAEPDLVITSDLRAVCATGSREARAMVAGLGREVEVLAIDAVTVEGVINAVQAVGAMTETEDEAMDVVIGLRERLQAVHAIVVGRRDRGFAAPRVAVLGWLNPLFGTGWAVPEQVRLAGGWELLGREGGRPAPTSWDAVRDLDPEILVFAPQGHDLPATMAAWAALERPDGWSDLAAVRGGRVFAVDGAAYFTHQGLRIVDGIEVLSELVDPLAFDGMAPPASWVRVG